ncbi:MAG: hypothetical protein RLZZ511_2923 [Cyanobacteriota bacterium]|jgi:hypothetical protein
MFTFNIIGVTPLLSFFDYQQQQTQPGITYFTSQRCSLDAVLRSLAHTDFDPTWDNEAMMQSVVNFWMNNIETITHWQSRLQDADQDVSNRPILVHRLAQPQALRQELETLWIN